MVSAQHTRRRAPRRRRGSVLPRASVLRRARVAERQTRWLQVPVPARACGFKSRLAHRSLGITQGIEEPGPEDGCPALRVLVAGDGPDRTGSTRTPARAPRAPQRRGRRPQGRGGRRRAGRAARRGRWGHQGGRAPGTGIRAGAYVHACESWLRQDDRTCVAGLSDVVDTAAGAIVGPPPDACS